MAGSPASHAAPAGGRSRNKNQDVNPSGAVQDKSDHTHADDSEDDDDFAVRREGEDDEEDLWTDDDDDYYGDDEDKRELRVRILEEEIRRREEKFRRRRLIDDEAEENSDNDSAAETATIDSTPPSTPSEVGFASRQPIFRGDMPSPVEKPRPLGGPTTFPQFMRLPTELRLRIWELHFPCSRQQRRVIRVINENRPLLVPWSLLARHTRALRQFMRISRETRAIGLRVAPDELPVEYGIVRFNAETDVVHVDYDDPHLLYDPAKRFTSKKREADLLARLPKFPYAHVRNLAIIDCEIRSREPGAYLDYHYGRSIIEFWSPDMVSHQRPQELRSPAMTKSLLERFPKLDNVYVVERANKRRINAWVGDRRPGNHQHFHIHTREGDGGWQSKIDYVYCWHEPPPAWLKQRHADRAARAARKKAQAAASGSEYRDGDSDGDIGCGSDSESKPLTGKITDKIEGDFENDVVVNHMTLFRSRGVRFSRMLLFELAEGLDIYHELRRECKPEGVWPVDSNGQPVQDDPPLLDDDDMMDDDDSYGDEDDESSWIDDDDDDPEGDDGSGDDEDIENELLIVDPNFSGPEGTPSDGQGEGEDGGEGNRRRRRAKRRRVVTDSDDETTGEGGESAGGRGAGSDSDGPPPAKRMTLAERLSKGREEHPLSPAGSSEEDEEDEDEDEDEEAGDYGLQNGDEDEDEDEGEGADEMSE